MGVGVRSIASQNDFPSNAVEKLVALKFIITRPLWAGCELTMVVSARSWAVEGA